MPRSGRLTIAARAAIVVLRSEGYSYDVICDRVGAAGCSTTDAERCVQGALSRSGLAADAPPLEIGSHLALLLQNLDGRKRPRHGDGCPEHDGPDGDERGRARDTLVAAPGTFITIPRHNPNRPVSIRHPAVSKTPGKLPDLVIEPGKQYTLNNPERLPEWRQRLFSPSGELLLNADQFNTYWPYVSNVFTKDATREKKNGTQVTHFNCRLRRKTHVPTKPGPCRRAPREGKTCEGAIKVDYVPVTNTYVLKLIHGHSHHLESVDNKPNNGIRHQVEMVIVTNPDAGGTEILDKLRSGDGGKQLEDAGGK